MPSSLDNCRRSPRKLLGSVVERLLYRRGRQSHSPRKRPLFLFAADVPVRSTPIERVSCHCFAAQRRLWQRGRWRDDPAEYRRLQRDVGEVSLHVEEQDTDCDAWKRLLELVEKAALENVESFAPLDKLVPGDETKIVTLPRSIAKLKSVKRLSLYGSSLVRIPPEIGQMSNLEYFDPYTSYRLHWLPYEITRCPNLRSSRVSTRALYGNFKYRWTFPCLERGAVGTDVVGRRCSVCDRPSDHPPLQVWISLWVATDVLPLLVNACSEECIGRLPPPAEGYVEVPHRGGAELEQPDPSFGLPAPFPRREGA
jgi:hypothetical protein